MNSKLKKSILIIIQIILIGCLIWSGSHIINWIKENRENSEVLDKVRKSVTISEENSVMDAEETADNERVLNVEEYNVDFSQLNETNTDIVGWVKVNNTNIEYPVVQAKDNDYYLTHSFDKSWNSAGWIFADFRNRIDGTDKNIIIYGHNRKDNSMFATLNSTLEESWYLNPNNRNVIFITKNGKYNYEVFSVYQIASEDYYITTNFSSTSFEKFINDMKKRSIYDFSVDVSGEDSILTLSTCGASNMYRTVLHAKLVR